MSAIRLAIVGLGKIAQLHHLPNLVESADVEIVALCDASARLAAELAARYGLHASTTTNDLEAVLSERPDALVVANRNHAPVLRQALARGIPTFVEKPMCWSISEADEVVALADRTATPLVVGHMRRFDPAVEVARKAVQSVRYARFHNFAGGRHRCERLYPIIKPFADAGPEGGHEDRLVAATISTELGDHAHLTPHVRTLAELAIHDLDLAQHLLGPAECVSAAVHPTDVGTCYLLTLSHSDTISMLEILPDFASAKLWDEAATLYGPAGSMGLEFDSPFLRTAPTILTRTSTDGLEATVDRTIVSHISPFRRELDHFLDVVRGTTVSRSGPLEAADGLRLIYRIARMIGTPR
ncbi:Gfo/Idh/MocA family protein [Nocardia nova]